ncbi:MAG TPA: DUF1573 domain-containing protein [Bacteroidia bacterium]|jgi:hypothetical protein|nr:DUF1573 domain-containing protein [Bacteroidia bacterium]
MIKSILTLVLVGLSYQLTAQAQLKFVDAKKSFGFVKKGEQVKLTYEFTNMGNQPLFITDAKAECSCTKITWPKEPILPGKSSSIDILFDTAPTYDRQDRVVEVFSNDAKSPQKIRFKGVVVK